MNLVEKFQAIIITKQQQKALKGGFTIIGGEQEEVQNIVGGEQEEVQNFAG
ncbi:hypothetical protein [Microscilla marina]|uniref:Uncharacterized protein n=1 Tax=Microscilla marina ATCC 23134 TaxID=313606 RepID=A1ZP76_MICM2|nr:hypothetical protein [Microscilla marina]EAY27868.1 hypothetical protein M23134_00309 [Microscilla marina ATCC 23134]